MDATRVFVSYASEDRAKVAVPLADELRSRGMFVWIDQFVMNVGDPLLATIDAGLRECDVGVVILSPHFFGKAWTERELAGLFAREEASGSYVLPVWHDLDAAGVREKSPILADRVAVSTNVGVNGVADALIKSIRNKIAGGEEGGPGAYIVGMAATGETLAEIVTSHLLRELDLSGDVLVRLELFEDGSGLDDEESFVECQPGILRLVTGDDVKAALRRVPVHPQGWEVVEWAVSQSDIDRLGDLLAESGDSGMRTFGLRSLGKVQYVLALNPQLIPDDEVVPALEAYLNFPVWWPDSLHQELWNGFSSFGRRLLRRLANHDLGHRVAHLVGADSYYGYRDRASRKDRRQWLLANAILREFTADQLRGSTPLGVAVASKSSGLDGVWRLAFERKLAGDPEWDRHRFERDVVSGAAADEGEKD